ncbi:hypothetical protein BWQ96_06268 [Gracilariopsis chorda]|uniref:Mediator of RNA polymerase II transcription subunit 18 n=1 Tax=Gracilariopsis chorda TaxID=448386 RepID=A0A2V3IPF1_9FLOR|nr:hypothetical protein BWQ96_06268 [Gracilariopsis chorda]|eukprot:PXF43958.1 hypothetical protein BWQ96_06268 [Gracilariopsis chorda]
MLPDSRAFLDMTTTITKPAALSAEPTLDQKSVTRTVIRGTFPLSSAEPIVFLIKCLCSQSGQFGDFNEWDRVYSMSPETSTPKNSILLRNHSVPNYPDLPVSLFYLGRPERRVTAPCERRSITAVSIGREADAVLSLLGCTFVYEYMRKGLRCRTRNGIVIEIFTIERFQEKHDVHSTIPLLSDDEKYAIIELISDTGASPQELEDLMRHISPHVSLHTHPNV